MVHIDRSLWSFFAEHYSDTAQYETSNCGLQGSEHRVGFSNVCKFHYFTVPILVSSKPGKKSQHN